MTDKRRLVVYPDTTVLLPPRYYGSITWYAALASCGNAVVDYNMPFNKRMKETHRCDIVDTHGVLSLTLPIEKPHDHQGRLSWSDIGVSPHGDWWNVHRVSLESAYGRTPFFEFYIDRFMPVLRRGVLNDFPLLADVDRLIDREIRDILLLPPDNDTIVPTGNNVLDLRNADFAPTDFPPYYQVRADILGFTPGLSILDLIFNLGPESPLYLRDFIKANPLK